MNQVEKICAIAKENSNYIAQASTAAKNEMLTIIAQTMLTSSARILAANKVDVDKCDREAYFIDRMRLTEARLVDISNAVIELTKLSDPIGEIIENWTADNGLKIRKISVPLGVLAIIYEARPNVTVDAISLCIKSGNAVVLRGSKETLSSNIELVAVIKDSLKSAGFNAEFIQLIEDDTREGAGQLLKCRQYVDVILPRGSAGLINFVVANSSVPVIETGAGNCSVYVHESGDIAKAIPIIINAKTQRPSVCNTIENLLIDEAAIEKLPMILQELAKYNVEIRGCDKTCAIYPSAKLATEDDYFTEFLAYCIAVKVVDGIDEAIEFINKHSTKHSETIIAEQQLAIDKFQSGVDSAVVYANASTRFTDGFEFGFGAEMGISTQKLHARGPLGLKQLTSYKYIVDGNGQIRK